MNKIKIRIYIKHEKSSGKHIVPQKHVNYTTTIYRENGLRGPNSEVQEEISSLSCFESSTCELLNAAARWFFNKLRQKNITKTRRILIFSKSLRHSGLVEKFPRNRITVTQYQVIKQKLINFNDRPFCESFPHSVIS